MKIVFMGTPDFAVPAMEALINAGHEIVLAVTQPDKEKGRGKAVSKSAVKVYSESKNIPVFQPVKIKTAEATDFLRHVEADVFVVAAFGQILSKEILDMPRYGCINIHASLLPKYRGAAPIQWSVINGDEYTGVTIMKMDVGLDTGDIMLSSKLKIDENETGGSLFDKLSLLGGSLIVSALDKLEKNEIVYTAQDDSVSCYAKMLTKETGLLNFNESAESIARLVRGCDPWPGTYSYLSGKTFKIFKCKEVDYSGEDRPGTVTDVDKESITIACKEGALRVSEVQIEGKKRMSVHDFLLGYHINKGDRIG